MAVRKTAVWRAAAMPAAIILSLSLEEMRLKLNRFGAALIVLTAGAVIVSACGGGNHATGGSATAGSPSAKVACGGKPTLKASGSTAQENAMTRFVKAFEQACPGQSVNYTANGSGAGITEFMGNQTDFGSSDSPLSKDQYTKADQRCGSPVWNLPVVFGPIAIAYNVNGVTSLNLDGAISETEDQYQTMWVNNSAAMSRYQAASAQATMLPQFTSPSSMTNPTGLAAQASVVPAATTTAAPAALATSSAASPLASVAGFDPNSGWFGLGNIYANQFVSSGFPINMLSYLAQNSSAQALQNVGSQIDEGLFEGEAALGGPGVFGGPGAFGAFGAAGLSQEPTAAIGVGVSMGKLTAPPAVVGLLPASQAPVQLASAVSPLPAGQTGLPMLPPIMPPPMSAGSGWRKRKQQKYEDLAIGAELKGTVVPRPPSAG